MLEHSIYQYFWYVKYCTNLFGNIQGMNEIRFAENLKILRRTKGLTQAALASLLGVDQRTVSAWENGISEPSFTILSKLCDIFDEDYNSLLK